jgi:plastocyanin
MRRRATCLAALAALGLGACGGDDETTTDTSTNQGGPPITNTTGQDVPSTVELGVDPDGGLAYDQTELTVAAGQPTIVLTNDSGIDHDVAVEDANGNVIGKSDVISSGSSEASFTAESDVYTFFCTVDAHREAGMEGTLTVVNN